MPRDATLAGWLAWLETLHPSTIDLGLERVHEVRRALGLAPAFPIITVGGTNGKGSTCAYLEAILGAAGYKTGLYTSPHLLAYNERVRIAGVDASDADLLAAFARVEAARGATSLTYFEFGTLAALEQFVAANVDVAILEVGLGGRLDAVNVFDADAAVVTAIDIDHSEYLGTTREAIGFEKAGIFRPGRPAICADPAPPQSLLDHAAAIGANLLRLGVDFDLTGDGAALAYRGPRWRVTDLPRPAMAGSVQWRNAAAALAALEALAARVPVGAAAIRQGLGSARVAGRFQVIAKRPEIVLDVAHNPQAARALAGALGERDAAGRTLAVVGMLADKDAAGVVDALAAHVDTWFVATPDSPRALAAARLAEVIRERCPGAAVRAFASPADALDAARSAARENDRIVVFGSFYTVAAALTHHAATEQ